MPALFSSSPGLKVRSQQVGLQFLKERLWYAPHRACKGCSFAGNSVRQNASMRLTYYYKRQGLQKVALSR
eukprot:scaffold29779_cov19-Tisochrysis_lutea.AAC.1